MENKMSNDKKRSLSGLETLKPKPTTTPTNNGK